MTTVAAERQLTGSRLFWSADELERDERWRRAVPGDVGDEFAAFAAAEPDATAATFRWDPARLPRLLAFGAELRHEVLAGRGVCWLRGLHAFAADEEQLRMLYVALGCALGEPMLQYGRLYPVVDRGASYKTESVPVSMTNAETCFHTDSSSVGVVPDFVGLLCEQPSANGGDSLVSNALLVHAELRRTAPDVLALLQRPWTRDVVTPGTEKTLANLRKNRFPVFADSDRAGGVLFRYMRYWIEVGQEKAGAPLDATERAAFDALDALLERPEHVVRFRLAAGDALWVNNRVLAHNRTAYRDTPGNVRSLQRMWIQVPDAAERG